MNLMLCIRSKFRWGIRQGKVYEITGSYSCPCGLNPSPLFHVVGARMASKLCCMYCRCIIPPGHYGPQKYFVPLLKDKDKLGVTEEDANDLYDLEPETETV